jgi:hypothetical protein
MKSDDEPSPETLAVSASLFDQRDRTNARNYAFFVIGSLRRHRLLALAVFASIVGATIGSFFVLPKTYHVEAKALAQPTSALTVRGDGPGAESLTRVAADTVMRQDNLLALIEQTDLLRYGREHRAPAQRARDYIARKLRGHDESDADRLDALVRLLTERLAVWTSDSGSTAGGSTVTIGIDWSDASMACRLVDGAQRAFLDARYAREITALSESIDILRRHTTSLQGDIDAAVGGIEKIRASRDDATASPDPVPESTLPRPRSVRRSSVARTGASDSDVDQVRAELRTQLQAKLHTIDEMESVRARQQSDLQARLTEARATFTENHPTVMDLKQSLATVSAESPQVTALRREAADLKAEYSARGARARGDEPAVVWTTAPAGSGGSASGTPPQVPSDVLRLALDLREDRDPAMVYARGQLRDAMERYDAMRAQIQTAQIDLETAQAAFKYRYTVVTPAHLPKSPTVPNVPLVTLAALLAGVLCSLLIAVLADLRTGRVIERWQVERMLERPILGEITLPDDASRA